MTRTIPSRESMTVELKSDLKRLPDRDLAEAVVCLANTQGGRLYLGVEKDGTVSGVHPDHENPHYLGALISSRTVPPLSVRVEMVLEDGKTVACIHVPHSRQAVATSDGTLKRRRLMADGSPQCVPFYPHEIPARLADLGLLDYSALAVEGASDRDLDSLERARLRQMIERFGGQRTLLPLNDEELDGALGLSRNEADGRRIPTVAGLLILGKEEALSRHLPAHETAFQLLDGTDVKMNEFRRAPLLKTFEWIHDQFSARVVEEEFQSGLFRIAVPNFDRRAFREALVNALIHRDYTRLGAVHIRWDDEGITVSNPGGFVEGVTVENLLIVDPRPRNPLLAGIVSRIGLAERTGRGVDLIYQGLLRYGRPAPDYTRSDATTVSVRLPGGKADLPLMRLILEEENRTQKSLPVESLIALYQLRLEGRITTEALARSIQRDEAAARGVLGRLVEAELAEAHGAKRGRTYTLSARVYRELGQAAGYVRQSGFDDIQQEEMVRKYARTHGKITRKDASELCRISLDQAYRLLHKLQREGYLKKAGEGRGSYYKPGNHTKNTRA
ncbi:MAG: putative DNA binding domain-containing protein [Planctomycetes bacterium]|nr:putative DNA binding domain-containing protein [Planctomycetota bacterium]